MRQLIVLLLVVGALATFFLVFNQGDPGQTPSLTPSLTQEPEGDAAPQPAEQVELERPEETRSAVAPSEAPRQERTESASLTNGLTGLVVDSAGKPVQGADVVLTRYGTNSLFFVDDGMDRSSDRTAKTTSKGRYTFSNVQARNDYSLKVSHPDFARHEVGNVAVSETGTSEEPRIVLREGISVSGYVRDTSNNAVPEARVYLSLNAFSPLGEEGPDTLSTLSDSAGKYEFKNVGAGQWTLAVKADGYGNITVPQVSVTGEVAVSKDVTLEVASMIGGRIIASGGEFLPEVEIQAFSLNQSRQQTRSTVKSDDEGNFVFEDVPKGSYTLLVNATGYEPWRKQRVDDGEMGVLVELVALPTVSGIVRDASTGEPLNRYTARLRQEIPNAPVAVPVQNTRVKVSDASGEFEIPVPKPGNYVIEAVADGYAMCFSAPFTISAGQNMPGVTIDMTRGGTISGVVVDTTGKPVRNARVTSRDKDWTDDEFTRALGDMMPVLAVERTVRTDADGAFKIEGLTPTEYKLEVTHPRHPPELKGTLFVNEGKTSDAGTIRMRAGGTVAGIVRDPSGNAVVGAVVTLRTAPGSLNSSPRTYTGKTDGDGRYEIANVSSGNYVATARRTAQSGVNPIQDWQDEKTTERQVSVSDGESQSGIDFALGGSRN